MWIERDKSENLFATTSKTYLQLARKSECGLSVTSCCHCERCIPNYKVCSSHAFKCLMISNACINNILGKFATIYSI